METNISDSELKFPNKYERKIHKIVINRSKGIEKIRNILFSYPSINKYVYEFKKIQKFYGISYLTNTHFSKNSTNSSSNGRIFPEFLLPGFPKCGSTSLWYYLNQHPNIFGTKHKETHFFSYDFKKGFNYYAMNFPINKHNPTQITFEASQSYLHDKFTMKRIQKKTPKMKFIVLFRNPVQKTISTYNDLVNNNLEVDSLHDCIKNEDERLAIWKKRHEYGTLTPYTYGRCLPYLHVATYVEHMKNALELFPREQFLFLDTQNLKNSPQSIIEKCFEFLDLPNFVVDTTKKNIGSYSSNLTNKAYEESSFLKKYFQPLNKQLQDLLGMNFNWD